MGTCYSHLSPMEREEISRGVASGASLRAIARRLARPPCTISREVRRNAPCRFRYRAVPAGRAAQARASTRRRPRKLASPERWAKVLELLRRRWSPEQIAGQLRRDYPDDVSRQASHETIYAAIYAMPRGPLRREILALLRRGHRSRMPRSRGEDRRGKIPNMTSIHDRPAEVDERVVPGHWEGDLIKGSHNRSGVGTLIERTTLFVVLAKLDGQSADEVRKAFERRLRRIPEGIRKTLTYDQGKEMAQHETLAANARIHVYFADPHSPWQRGIMENTNGLLREYLPKGADLSSVSQRELDTIALSLNTRPRKTLAFHTPLEVFEQSLQNQTVALGP